MGVWWARSVVVVVCVALSFATSDRRATAIVADDSSVCFASSPSELPPKAGWLAVVNLTPVNASAPGFGQLVSSSASDPGMGSNVNFGPGTIDPNIAAAVTGVAGDVCFFNSEHGEVDLVADPIFLLAPGAFRAPEVPVRLVDTRIGLGGSRLTPRERRCFVAGGEPGSVAFINLTPVLADAAGFGQLVSSDLVDPSLSSNVNFGPGTVDPNVATARIGADGAVCFVNSEHANLDLVADQLFLLEPDIASVVSDSPTRRIDTRIELGGPAIMPNERRCFGGVGEPGDMAVVNLTPVNASGPGFGLLVSSDDEDPGIASSVNFAVGSIDPNVAAAAIGVDGAVCFLNSEHSTVDLVVDHLVTIDGASTSGNGLSRFDTRIVEPSNVTCSTAEICLAEARGPAVVRSNDGGVTWYHRRLVGLDRVDSIECTPALCTVRDNGWFASPAAGRLGKGLWVSTDTGLTWNAAPSDLVHLGCPVGDVCIGVGHHRGAYGLTLTPFVGITRDGGHEWEMLAAPVDEYECDVSGDCPPPPVTLFGPVTCAATDRCRAGVWTGGTLEFSTSDGWTTVMTEILP